MSARTWRGKARAGSAAALRRTYRQRTRIGRSRPKAPHRAYAVSVAERAGRALLAAALAGATVSAALAASAPATAQAAAPVVSVPDDSFAPEGYEWSFDFESVSSESGFTFVDDLEPHYSAANHSDPRSGTYDCVKAGDAGYFAAIGNGTEPLSGGKPRYALRFENGTYNGAPIDAVVSLVEWDYLEPSGGWDGYWMRDDSRYRIRTFRTGVFFNLGYTSDVRYRHLNEQDAHTNMNFYLVGLTRLVVDVEFVHAGTNDPVDVKGHLTSIDLDAMQAMSYSGAIDRVEIAESSLQDSPEGEPFLSIRKDASIGDLIEAGRYAVSATGSDGYYQRGLVGAYFDTAGKKPLHVTFIAPWSGNSKGNTGPDSMAISFFALTPEYVANPPATSLATVAKTADRTSAAIEEPIAYRVDVTFPVEGITCRMGYRYPSLSIADDIDEHLSVDPESLVVLRDGKPVEGAGSFSEDAEGGTVSFVFSERFLESEPCEGQTLSIGFTATAHAMPPADSEGRRRVANAATIAIGDDAELATDPVWVDILPRQPRDVTVEKRVRADEVYWNHGEPTFLFELEGVDETGKERAYVRIARIEEGLPADASGNITATAVFQDVPAGVYTLRERDALRYRVTAIETSGEVGEDVASVVLDLAEDESPYAVFSNEKTSNYGGSDVASVVNSFTL